MKILKSTLVCFALSASALTASAYSGGVTTYAKPTPTTVQRIVKSTATAGAEQNATYQRTMRTAQTSAAAAKAARGVIKSFAVIGTVVSLATFAFDLAAIWKKDANGENVLVAPDPSVCSVGPCYEYNAMDAPRPESGWASSGPAACSRFVAYLSARFPDYSYSYAGMVGTDQCLVNAPFGQFGQSVAARQKPPSLATLKELTALELEDQIAKSIHLPEILDELDKKGFPVPFPDPEVEDMPQPIALSPSVTTHPDGSKTITQTTLEPSTGPDGKTINWRKNEKTTEVSPPDANGNTTSKVTDKNTDTGQSQVEKGPEAPAIDSALPDQPKLYTKKYPDGMTGVWRDQRASMANSPLFTLPRLLMPSSIGSSGACPVMNVNLTFSQWANFGTKDVAPPCYVWDWAKAICIVGACLLARRLIFGG